MAALGRAKDINTDKRIMYRDANRDLKEAYEMVDLYYYSSNHEKAYSATLHVVDKLPQPVVLGLKDSLGELLELWLEKSPEHILRAVKDHIGGELSRRYARVEELRSITDDGYEMSSKEHARWEAKIAKKEKEGKEKIAEEIKRKAETAARGGNPNSPQSVHGL